MRRISGNTIIFRTGGVEVSVLVDVSGSILVVPLSEFPVGVDVGTREGTTGELSFGDDTLGTGGSGGGACAGNITLGSGMSTGSCCRGSSSLSGTFCAFGLFLKISTSFSHAVFFLLTIGDKELAGDGLRSADVRLRAAAMKISVKETIGITDDVGYHDRVSVIRLANVSHAQTQ